MATSDQRKKENKGNLKNWQWHRLDRRSCQPWDLL